LNLRKIISRLLFIAFISLPTIGFSQDLDERSPQHRYTSKQSQKAEKKKAAKRQKAILADKKAREHAQQIQDKQTRKRMKQSRHEADRINANKRKFFLTRWFTKKHR
jgi:hypothetical protein